MQFTYSRLYEKAKLRMLVISLIIVFNFVSCMPPKPATKTAQQPPIASNSSQTKSLANLAAKINNASLEIDKTIEQELKGDETQTYELSLPASYYLHLVIEQKGIDVVVEVYAPDGQKIHEVDSPNGTNGPEPVSLITTSEGIHKLGIRSLEKDAQVGKYEIQIKEFRIATDSDRFRLDAHRAYNEAGILRDKNTIESLDQATVKYKEAISLFHFAGDKFGEAKVRYSFGDFCRARKKFDEAESTLQSTLFLYEEISGLNSSFVGDTCNLLAVLYKTKGEYDKAEPLYKRALTIQEKNKGQDHPDVAESYNNLGTFYDEKGDHEKAVLLYNSALVIFEKSLGPDHPAVAIPCYNLGQLHVDKGNYDKAEPLLQKALAIDEKRSKGQDRLSIASGYDGLGSLYSAKGDYDRAEPLLQKALAMRDNLLGDTDYVVAESYNNLGNLYILKKDYDKAEPLLQKALTIFEKTLGQSHPFVAFACYNLGDLRYLNKEYTEAEYLYKRSLAIREKALGENHPLVALSCNRLGILHQDKGDYDKAESFFKKALVINEIALGQDSPYVALNYYFLGNFYQAKGNIKEAIFYNKRGNESREKDFLHNLNTGSEKQKLIYINTSAYEQDFTISLNLQYAPKDKEATETAITAILRRKGRALDATTNAIANLRSRASKEDIQLLDQLTIAKTSLTATLLTGVGKEGVNKYKEKRELLEKQVEELENKVSARNTEFKVSVTPINLETIQKAIPSNALLIEFATYTHRAAKYQQINETRYVVYTLDNKGNLKCTDLGDVVEIDKAIEELRQVLIKQQNKPLSNVEKELKPKARALDKLVMLPVRQLVGEAKRLLISPDGHLNLIPFDVLVNESGKYLVENYEISYLTSGRDLLRLQNGIKSEQRSIVIADPNYGEGNGTKIGDFIISGERLKATADEANQIQQTLNLQAERILVQDQATKAALKELHRPEILHIATHGFFLKEQGGSSDSRRTNIKTNTSKGLKEEEQKITEKEVEEFKLSPLLKSGLLLAGANKGNGDEGVITALEATTLDLWGTKLVVLSACDTGVGEVKNGDGVYGLRRALVLAGSESQLMSLWPVSDSGTRDLMIKYYQALNNGEGRSSALRKVRLELLKDPKRSHPYYWASFIQSGEWANLYGER